MTIITFIRYRKKLVIIGSALGVLLGLVVIVLLVTLTRINVARGSVVTNGYACSRIGTEILKNGGTAVDAAIAALFCEGITMPQAMGLGGGFLLTYYQKSTGEAWSLNSRETAPAAATADMFLGNDTLSAIGGLAIAVPGELRGYWSLYNRFGGGVAWRDLLEPTIDLCENGVYVTAYMAKSLKEKKELLMQMPELRDIFIDEQTNDTYVEGDYFRRPKLAETLRIIADEGGDTLHNGSLTEAFVKDIQDANGIITVYDLNNYQPIWSKLQEVRFSNNQKMFTTPLPGSGSILTFILNILDGYLDTKNPKSITNYQRLVESFKFGYGRRTKLGDHSDAESLVKNLTSRSFAEEIRKMIFNTKTFDDISYYGAETLPVEDHGTAHINVLAPNGDAVAVTSTINGVFGSYVVSPSTGILLNNQMDDFSSPGVINLYGLPPSPSNFIVPGRRPLSSMCPSIILDSSGKVVLCVGAAGGSKITTQVAQIIINHLWFGMDLKSVMDEPRIHHQLIPNYVQIETDFGTKHSDIVKGLQDIGHNITVSSPDDGFAAASAISTVNEMSAVCDIRRPGSSSYIH